MKERLNTSSESQDSPFDLLKMTSGQRLLLLPLLGTLLSCVAPTSGAELEAEEKAAHIRKDAQAEAYKLVDLLQ